MTPINTDSFLRRWIRNYRRKKWGKIAVRYFDSEGILFKDFYFLALDFDGTLVENDYPKIGKIKENIILELRNKTRILLDQGYFVLIILWTCRQGKELKEAVKWCKDNGIYLDFVNKNPITFFNSPKIYADEYWDDRSVKV